MHPHISKLYRISEKPARLILGLMSGTSLDGLDIALCKISGQGKDTQCEVLDFVTVDYCEKYRANVRKVFAKQLGSIESVCLLNAWIGAYHARLVNETIQKMGYMSEQIDLIASHGQTIYHCPVEQHGLAEFSNATLQIGDGDHIAVQTNIITLSDFRQKHIAAGGQGAPLVMYGDYLMFHSLIENRIMLNIGGIANLTFLPCLGEFADVFSSDVGPGNTLMDAYMRAYFAPQQYDKNAQVAMSGKADDKLVDTLLGAPFFSQHFPKTTGPEVFNIDYLKLAQQQADCTDLSHQDVMASLSEFSARCIADSIYEICRNLPHVRIYTSGGGIHNPLLMQRIQSLVCQRLPNAKVASTDVLALNPDAKEAVLFALLANQTLCATDKVNAHTKANMPQVSMGKVSFPD